METIPNHVINILKIKKLNKSQIWEIMNRMTDFNPDDPLADTSGIDFDKIIPSPKTKKECPEDCLMTPDSHVSVESDRPWFNWYDWNRKYWGTKWNAYNRNTHIGSNYVQFIFQTAWSMPGPIYNKLAKIFKEYEMEVKWADEDLGNNCGQAVHNPGRDAWDEGEILKPNAQTWARRLWNKYD